MSLRDWFKKKAAALSIAFTNVEKELVNQKNNGVANTINNVTSVNKGTLADDLMRGEMTQEVRNLRWRMYKVMQHADKLLVEHNPETGETKVSSKNQYTDYNRSMANAIKVDKFDIYEPQMAVYNEGIARGIAETDLDGKENYHKMSYTEKPIRFEYKFIPKYEFVDFVTKLIVRKISDEEKLLEFYVSKYPDENNFTSNIFLKEVKKLIDNPRLKLDFLEFNEVGFITDKTIGADDHLMYSFINKGFDKIVDFDGHYVLKFKAAVDVNGEKIFDKFKEDELEKKYENMEAKHNTGNYDNSNS
jgi:hypothetical protein